MFAGVKGKAAEEWDMPDTVCLAHQNAPALQMFLMEASAASPMIE